MFNLRDCPEEAMIKVILLFYATFSPAGFRGRLILRGYREAQFGNVHWSSLVWKEETLFPCGCETVCPGTSVWPQFLLCLVLSEEK